MAQADPILPEFTNLDIANQSLALICTAEGVLHEMQYDIESTQALAELIQDTYLQSDYRNATLSALFDAMQNRTCYALTNSEKGAAGIEKVFSLFRWQAGIRNETRNTDEATDACSRIDPITYARERAPLSGALFFWARYISHRF